MIFGFNQLKIKLYAGPVYQTVKGNIQLRGAAYGGSNFRWL
jgi:long-chain fatty acid transport protein